MRDAIAPVALRVIVPDVPDAVLSPNAREHWAKRAKATKALRTATWAAAIRDGSVTPIRGPVRMTACIYWPKHRQRMDADNAAACLKGLIDGLTDARVWLDDRQLVASPVVTQERLARDARGNYPGGCVVVEIEAVER